MNNIDIKKRVIEECLNIQIEKAHNAEQAMIEAQQAANEYGLPKDRYDSFRTQQLSKKDMFAKQLSKYIEEIKLLQRIDPEKVNESVVFGSIVVTEENRFFVSVSIGKINVDGNMYFAISPAVPIFQVMAGKKMGDSFSFNGKSQKIKEAF
ncbi:MAG: hypothetical protein Q8880_10925 [Bacteroidota bacterium]|nr:hypothetical protein [Bacteroidota bacterium]